MPKAWSDKDERQYEHIKSSAKKKGRSTKTAKRIAAATVNKERSEEGRTKAQKSRKRKSASTKKSSKSRKSSKSKSRKK